MAIIALDTFTDTDAVNLPAHTPDLGFGGYEMSGAANEWAINSNQANKALTNNDTQFLRCTNDIIDDEFEVYFDFTRGSAGDFAGEREGIYFLAHKTTAIANGEGVQAVLIRSSGSAYNLFLKRLDSAGVEQQSVFLTVGLSIGTGSSIRLGATISGLSVQVWTEPAGGGSRTNRGSAVTLTVDLRDGDHQRIGMTGRSESNGVGPLMDNLTVETFTTDGEVQVAASMQCATVIAFDDLNEDGVNLAAHVPDLGFTSWEEFAAGQFAGEVFTMANFTVSDVIARSGEDVAINGIDFRIQVDQFRSGADEATQRGRLVFLGRGADTIDQNGGFERIEVGWERISSTLVSMEFRRFNAADAQQEGAQIGSNFTFPINAGLRMFVTYEHPNITVHTAPRNTTGPKTLIGSIAISGDIRGANNQRIGISSGAGGVQRTFFDDLIVYSLGPSGVPIPEKGVVQIPADMRVIQQNIIFVNASINAGVIVNSEVSVDCSINALQQNEVQVIASISLVSLAAGQIFVGSSVEVVQRGQIQIVSSLQPSFNGEESVLVSIVVDQRIDGQISAQASALVKHSGAIEDLIFEDNRINIVEIIQPILWRD